MKKFNTFDLLIALIVILVAVFFIGVKVNHSKNITPKRQVVVTVDVNYPEIAEAVYDEATKDQTVYLNSVNKPLKTVEVKKVFDSNNNLKGLSIALEAEGEVGDKYIVNGQRVLIGQKAEIHGNYFAPGSIGSVKYAN